MKKRLLIISVIIAIVLFGGFALFTYACYEDNGGYSCLIDNQGKIRKHCVGSYGYFNPGEKCPSLNLNELRPLKPVIYLYPPQPLTITVKLDYHGTIIADYPAYNQLLGGWQVLAQPDGTLTNLADDQEYSYLFWEGESREVVNYDWSQGWLIKGSDTREFLQQTLAQIGLTPKEYNEFIVYWYPQMKDNPYNLIHFATAGEYDVYAPLTITPHPDNILRVFMVYRSIVNPTTPSAPAPQTFPVFTRDGFTVIEWGGSQLDTTTSRSTIK